MLGLAGLVPHYHLPASPSFVCSWRVEEKTAPKWPKVGHIELIPEDVRLGIGGVDHVKENLMFGTVILLI
jgi:hypothetical protein